MSFGQKLKHLRENSGKSQTKVVSELNENFPDFSISQTYLSALENKDSAPREELLEIFAEYFGVPITYFVEHIPNSNKSRSGIELAKEWLKTIRKSTVGKGKSFARAEGYQSENDEVSNSLKDMMDNYDDEDEHLDF
jgi:transcriptional regulator with XRE-family HTH domain